MLSLSASRPAVSSCVSYKSGGPASLIYKLLLNIHGGGGVGAVRAGEMGALFWKREDFSAEIAAAWPRTLLLGQCCVKVAALCEEFVSCVWEVCGMQTYIGGFREFEIAYVLEV